ncbi:MAG: lamin tail domain-containing protein [Rhodanobacteraceae bacterium]|nr:lamin tail domain-containing protein [Rhodanobacteraceae bacterium]
MRFNDPRAFVCAIALSTLAPPLPAQGVDPVFSNQFEDGVATLSPDLVYARSGTITTGIAGPLIVRLVEPAAADIFVPIVSLAPTRLTVAGGGTTVLAGETDAVVTMNALSGDSTPVLLRAQLGNVAYGSVRVVDDAEPRNVVSIRPNPASIAPGGSRNLIARLDLPAPLGGTTVDLGVSPIAAGSLPATLAIATDSFSQSFTYTDLDVTENAMVSASVAGGPAAFGSVVQSPIGKLVINEIDYDQIGLDSTEYIEIHNRSPDTVPLAGLAVVLVNGTDSTEYARFNLADAATSLAPNTYLMLGSTGLNVPNGVPYIDIGTDSIVHNGAPDAVAIIDSEALTVIDALSYEGSVTAASIEGFVAPVSLVEGTTLAALDDGSAVESLSRLPNGNDNNNADTDFSLTALLTPGTSNDPPLPASHLVINEVDYDQAGTDAASFIEIYNGTGNAVSLTNLAVALVNGNGNIEYGTRFNLSVAGSSLASGQFLVIRNGTVTVPGGVLTIDTTGDFVQNGPDGIALIDTSAQTLIDALSYEGSLTAVTFTGFPGTYNLVEGTAFSGADTNDNLNSLARLPNGTDINNASSDWALTTTITPGAANAP